MNGRTGTATPGRIPDPHTSGPGDSSGARPAPAQRTGGGRGTAAAAWPLFSGLGPLGALPTAPGLARAFTALVLGGWGLGSLTDTAELVVSELASNVVAPATGPDGRPAYRGGAITELWLRLMADGAQVRVEVWDNLPAEVGVPAIRHASPDAESGRGLELVAALSSRWGWDPVPGIGAKAVWALLPIQQPVTGSRQAAPVTSVPREAAP